ncbi:MAG: hypothetical protein WCJ99_17835 [Betaproteobacteria bacterium]
MPIPVGWLESGRAGNLVANQHQKRIKLIDVAERAGFEPAEGY